MIIIAVFLHLRSPDTPEARPCGDAGSARARTGHGEQQLEAMLRDSPAMRMFVMPGDDIWQWTVSRFEGAGTGLSVHWSSANPAGRMLSDCYWSDDHGDAYIRVRHFARPGTLKAFETLWSKAVFELLNLEGWREYRAVYRDALKGNVSLDQWIERNTRLEYAAHRRLKAFFARVWRPWARRVGVELNPTRWKVSVPDSYGEWMSDFSMNDPDGYPWNPWGEYYETQIVPYLKKSAKAAASRASSEGGD